MFCIKCGKEIPGNASFCPFCGAVQSENAAAPGEAETGGGAGNGGAAASDAFGSPGGYARPINQSPIRKAQYNLLCILGLVISLISLVFNYFGLVGLGGIIVSVIGLVHCNRRRENGRILGALGVLFGAVSVITAVLAML